MTLKIKKQDKLWEKWKDKELECHKKLLLKNINKKEQLDNIDK